MGMMTDFLGFGEFYRNPLSFLKQRHQLDKSKTVLQLGHRRIVFLYHPDQALRVLVTARSGYSKSHMVFNRIRPLTGQDGLVQLEGERWMKSRVPLNRYFSSEMLASFRPVIDRHVDRFESFLDSHVSKPVHLVKPLTQLVLDIALELFAGPSTDSDAASGLQQNFLKLNMLCGKNMLLPFPFWDPRILIAERKLNLSMQQYIQNSPLRSRTEKISGEGPNFLRDQIKTFLFAGHETTASTLIMALWNLATYEMLQKKTAELQGESQVKEIQNFIHETMRLYPAAWILAREANSDDIELGIRIGDTVIIAIAEIHRHRDFWQDPDVFEPARFNNELKHPMQFIPFGAGPKVCIGKSLALMEVEMILSRLLIRYRWQTHRDSKMQVKTHITMFPEDSLVFTFTRR